MCCSTSDEIQRSPSAQESIDEISRLRNLCFLFRISRLVVHPFVDCSSLGLALLPALAMRYLLTATTYSRTSIYGFSLDVIPHVIVFNFIASGVKAIHVGLFHSSHKHHTRDVAFHVYRMFRIHKKEGSANLRKCGHIPAQLWTQLWQVK